MINSHDPLVIKEIKRTVGERALPWDSNSGTDSPEGLCRLPLMGGPRACHDALIARRMDVHHARPNANQRRTAGHRGSGIE
jgi:hypothetical protein